MSRHAVSLAQLPPPIEADTDEKEEFNLPPPPEFEGSANMVEAGEPVLAPPPQFSDGGKHQSKVRIVGAVPKGNPASMSAPKMKQGRLHSQWFSWI